MNYGISVLFRAIPLLMALFCFGYGAFVLGMGTDPARYVAGPVVMSLGMICIALFATAATIIRQIIHTYNTVAKYALPVLGYLAALLTFIYGWEYFSEAPTAGHFVAGHVICGVAFLRGHHRHFVHPLHPYPRQLRRYGSRHTPASLQRHTGQHSHRRCSVAGTHRLDMDYLAACQERRSQRLLHCRTRHGRHLLHLHQSRGVGGDHRTPDTQQLLAPRTQMVACRGTRDGHSRHPLGLAGNDRTQSRQIIHRLYHDRFRTGLLQHLEQSHTACGHLAQHLQTGQPHPADTGIHRLGLPVPLRFPLRDGGHARGLLRTRARTGRLGRHLFHAILHSQHTGKRYLKRVTAYPAISTSVKISTLSA